MVRGPPIRLVVQPVENIFVVSNIVYRQEFRRIQKVPRPDAIDRNKVAELRRPITNRGVFSPGPEGSAVGFNASERLARAQPGNRARVHHQARLIAVLRVRRTRNELHALNRIRRQLRGEYFALLVVDRLAVDHKTNLCVIAQRMKESVGVRCGSPGAVIDDAAQPRSRIEPRQFQERRGARVRVGRRIGINQCGCFRDIDARGHFRHFERNIQVDCDRRAQLHLFFADLETGRGNRQFVHVGRDVIKAESASLGSWNGLVEASRRIAQLHLGTGDNHAGRVQNGAGHCPTADGLRPRSGANEHQQTSGRSEAFHAALERNFRSTPIGPCISWSWMHSPVGIARVCV